MSQSSPYWYDKPSVLLDAPLDLLPKSHMNEAQKFNAISRTIMISSLALSTLFGRPQVLLGGAGILGFLVLRNLNNSQLSPQFIYDANDVPIWPNSEGDTHFNGLPGQVYNQVMNADSDYANNLLIDKTINQRLPLPPTHFDAINGQRYLIQKLCDYDDETEVLFNHDTNLNLQKFVSSA